MCLVVVVQQVLILEWTTPETHHRQVALRRAGRAAGQYQPSSCQSVSSEALFCSRSRRASQTHANHRPVRTKPQSQHHPCARPWRSTSRSRNPPFLTLTEEQELVPR